jgi:3,4-dihydroxy-2-butanone 4-phosphate synthase
MAGLTPIVTACEMIGKNGSLPKGEAQAYAETYELTFIEGCDIVEAWEAWSQ